MNWEITKSGPRAKCIIFTDSYILPDVSEVIILNVFRVGSMDAHIHV